MPFKVGIYGATGYTGLELVRLLDGHPQTHIVFVTSESSAGQSLRQSWPQAPDLTLVTADDAPLNEVDGVFLCLPHTKSAPLAGRALAQNVRVVDLSADLRIDDPAVYTQWYKVPHPNPELLPMPYGLPELGRDKLRGATCIANPGCYATSVLLAAAPLVRADLLASGAPLIVDAKSGVSGAGRTPKLNILFGEVHGNFSPYNIGHTHRHLSEIEQELAKIGHLSGPADLLAAPAPHRPGHSLDGLRAGHGYGRGVAGFRRTLTPGNRWLRCCRRANWRRWATSSARRARRSR